MIPRAHLAASWQTSRVLRACLAVVLASIAACGGGTSDAPSDPPAAPPSSSGASSSSGVSPPDPTKPACAVPSNVDVQVGTASLALYPAYAVNGCTLVYVSRAGALVLRDLASGAERELEPAAAEPERPTVSDRLVAWVTRASGVPRVKVLPNGETMAVTMTGPESDEPRAEGNVVVYTASTRFADARADADVYMYDATSRTSTLVLGGAGQQRFAAVSPSMIAVTDFAEDPDGSFDGNETDLADVVLVERATGRVIRRRASGKQAFPFFPSSDVLAYLGWGAVHPEPKLTLFELYVASLRSPSLESTVDDRRLALVEQDGEVVAPSGSGGVVEWVTRRDGVSTLFRAPADGSAAPAAVGGLDGLVLFAPSAASAFTVLAASPRTGTFDPRLRVVPRQ